jgi:hypothetical protein
MEQEIAQQDALLAAVIKKREAARLRKQAQRGRDKIKKQTAKAAKHIEKELLEESLNLSGMAREDVGQADVIRRGLCFLGEVAPGRDGTNIHEALYSARTFAKALKEPDVVFGESLTDFERRVFKAWVTFEGFQKSSPHFGGSAPFLNMKTLQLEAGWGGSMFSFDRWVHLPGAAEVLTPEQIRESGTL